MQSAISREKILSEPHRELRKDEGLLKSARDLNRKFS